MTGPGIMLADAARTYVNRYGVEAGYACRRAHACDSGLSRRRSISSGAGVDVAAIARSTRPNAASPCRRRCGRFRLARPSLATRGRHRVSARADRTHRCRWRGDARRMDRLRSRRDVGWLDSVGPSLLAVARQGALGRWRASVSARCGGAGPSATVGGRRAMACSGSARHWRMATQLARAAAGAKAGAARTFKVSDEPADYRGLVGANVRSADRRARFRRFPERRDGKGSQARGARRLSLHRARQALHHDRHGDRPGQNVERQCAGHRRRSSRQADPGGRADDVPPAVHAGDVRNYRGTNRGELFDPVRRTPIDAWARGARRGVRGCRAVETRALFPARWRGHARGRRARMPDGAHVGRRLRRLDARQDRGRRAGRRGIPRAALHQFVPETRGRAAAATACC